MTAEAASRLGVEVAILEHGPAARRVGSPPRSRRRVGRARQAGQACAGRARRHLENEFVDAPSLDWLAGQGVEVYPTGRTLATVQDKLAQKRFMRAAGVPVPRFAEGATAEDIERAGREWGWPLLLKARRNGYDGYGNVTLRGPEEIAAGCERLGWPERTLLVEAWVPFTRELAVMVARGRTGECAVYPVVETVQRDHICHIVRAPAPIPAEVATRAARIARLRGRGD